MYCAFICFPSWLVSYLHNAKNQRSGLPNPLEAFLADLDKRRGIADWQVRQAEHALKILYEIFLRRYTPERQAAVGPTGKHPAQKAIARADGFWDQVLDNDLFHLCPLELS